MLKCGQTGNQRYSFGLRPDQMIQDARITEEKEVIGSINSEYVGRCSECGALTLINSQYCSSCGTKIE